MWSFVIENGEEKTKDTEYFPIHFIKINKNKLLK